jgi:hypothetical protein
MDILKRIIRWVRDRRNIGKQQTTSCCVQAEEACVATDAEPTKYHLTKSSHEIDTLKDYAERNPNNSRTESIMRICRERRVEELVHFTSIHNLATIFEYGLLSLDDLERLEIKYDYNDENRLGVCAMQYASVCLFQTTKCFSNIGNPNPRSILLSSYHCANPYFGS